MSTTIQDTPKCIHCGYHPHQGNCPRIKAIDYYPDGTIKHVEYHEAIRTNAVSTVQLTADDLHELKRPW